VLQVRRTQPFLAPARLALGFWLLGCSKPDAQPPAVAAVAAVPARHSDASARETSSPAPPNTAAGLGSLEERRAPLPGCSAGARASAEFTRIHQAPVLSAAVGTPPRAAVWSGRVATLFDAEKPRELPAPRLPPGAEVEIFFGRDNQPRLMGFVPGEPGKELPVYLRFRQGSFRTEPSELGPLAAPRGALYGVLGFADPEVVCRPRELCLVKRVTGWGRAAAHDAPVRIVLRGGSVFALHGQHVERLGERGWSALEPARVFEHPLDAWLAPNGELWIVDRSASGLSRLVGGRWETLASPIREPRAVFGKSENAVFVAGEGGAAEFDGTRFRCLNGVSGPLHLALAVGEDLWLAGESGVFRSTR
jgi:hypothetical protein